MIVCILLPRFELAVAAGGRRALLGDPAALRPSRGASSSWARSHRPPRRSASTPACGWARRWRAVPACISSRPTRSESPTLGRACSSGWRASARASSPCGRARPASTPRACAGCTAATSTGSWRRCAPRSRGPMRARRASAWGRRGSQRWPPPSRRGRGVPGGSRGAARSRGACRSRCCAAGRRRRRSRSRWSGSGSRRSGSLAALQRSALGDRFGAAGLIAHDLARGRDTPLRPRRVGESLEESLELPESASGPQLERALAPAHRPAAGAARARRAHGAGRDRGGPSRRGRHVARARRVPRADGGRRADAAGPRRPVSRRCPRRPRRCGWSSSASAPGTRTAHRAVRGRHEPSVGRACARRSGSRARLPGRPPRCACSRSIRARGFPSGARS